MNRILTPTPIEIHPPNLKIAIPHPHPNPPIYPYWISTFNTWSVIFKVWSLTRNTHTHTRPFYFFSYYPPFNRKNNINGLTHHKQEKNKKKFVLLIRKEKISSYFQSWAFAFWTGCSTGGTAMSVICGWSWASCDPGRTRVWTRAVFLSHFGSLQRKRFEIQGNYYLFPSYWIKFDKPIVFICRIPWSDTTKARRDDSASCGAGCSWLTTASSRKWNNSPWCSSLIFPGIRVKITSNLNRLIHDINIKYSSSSDR